ncbi:hypothetical protein [Jeongeupia naejangsanensis]|uniref:DUF2917 domain-containing protein n=1 Tax=Jeongeupia naejangsanensis TaxID=613195 RepID=A0ABS2BQ44_9NEIS|nr:hypothetical protein [Jeongeupia naejangsanensis]MBM3117066.1 hypothetical protein [Jeongeupia naejangsanensis]
MADDRLHRRLASGEVIRIHVLELTIGSGVVWATDEKGRDILLGAGDRLSGGAMVLEALQPSDLSWRAACSDSRLRRSWASVRRWIRAIFGYRPVMAR